MVNKWIKAIPKFGLLLYFIVAVLVFSLFGNNNLNAQSQKAADIGVMAGASYYMGDMNLAKHLYSPHLNIGGFMRYHFNPRYILRIGGFYSRISARDSDFNNDFQQLRNLEFETSLIELSAQVEFNFMPFIIGQSSRYGFSPYLQTGLVLYIANESHDFISFALPIGIGVKKIIGPRLVIGAEWAFRRSFSDMLDNITGEDIGLYNTSFSTPVNDVDWHKQYAFKYTKDWYSYMAITLTYAFRFGGLGCPAYYELY
jgi:hypothetical protein